MLPGFITLFKDDDNYIHLYFYKGLIDNGSFYYNDLDLSKCKYTYRMVENHDSSIEYIFDNQNIKSMKCRMITFDHKEKKITLNI